MLPSILILIPCYNEEQNIEHMLIQLNKAQKKIERRYGMQLEVLVVNDGSTDKSLQKLRILQKILEFHIETHSENYGYGKSLRTGFKFAIENDFSWVLSFDMDGQHEPKWLVDFIEAILSANPNLALISGSRYKNPDYYWCAPWKDRFLVNCIISTILAKFHIHVTDAFCGMKAFNMHEIRKIDLTLNGYDMPLEFWMKLHQNQMQFTEIAVPLIYKDRDIVKGQNIHPKTILEKATIRLRQYIDVINHFAPTPVKVDEYSLKILFQDAFNGIDTITQKNYRRIWEDIATETLLIVKSESYHEQIRCAYCGCSSGRC